MQKPKRLTWAVLGAACIAVSSFVPQAHGQATDALLDKLVDKGVITVKEANELREAASDAETAEEFGDLLFVLVNVARRHGIESEAALRAANDKFRRRFRSVERQAAEQGVALRDLDFAALDELWDTAKAEERAQTQEERIST